MGKLLGIAYKLAKYGEMIECNEANVGAQTGVENDVRGIPGKRQVTVLSKEGFDAACATLGQSLPWTTRRANLFVEGVNLEQSTGKFLSIGEILLEITGETEPCYRMDEQRNGLKEALQPHWRGGVTCRVLNGGLIRLNDAVQIIADDHE
ncbi:MAG: MOSC domain-containing protein [Bacteroidales bacterium]|nr:MOSC domain-containing protein [Bacteroidales bacterium]